MGSKNRIAKHILPIILKDRKPDQVYVEPFVGGANSICEVDGERIGGEFNVYISAMWAELEKGWLPPLIDKATYLHVKGNKSKYPNYVIGWVGICCSYSGKWFGGYAGKVSTKGGLRDYQAEAFANVKKQLPKIKGVKFVCSHYDYLDIPKNSIIYCDPPYAATTGYAASFNHETFWDWCRKKAGQGHKVFISEYNAPDDFISVWEQEVKSSLSANGKSGSSKKSIERLFVHKTQIGCSA
tara:strand:- start:430 stop:1149 length:720 start_codon:yes stop_codon:yes gene_type:complete